MEQRIGASDLITNLKITMIEKLKLTGIMATMFLVAFLLYQVTSIAYGAISNRISTNNPRELQNYTFFSATTTTATSTNLSAGGGFFTVAGAKKVTYYFTHGGAATTSIATSTFSVQVSSDGLTWVNFNKLVDNVTNSISQNLTRVSSVAIEGATSTKIYAMDLAYDTFYATRCVSLEGGAEGTQGEATCTATAEF